MTDEYAQQPEPEQVEQTEEIQPSTEAPNEGAADGTGAPAQVAESEAAAAERIVAERKIRQERARRNQEAAFHRLASERDEFKTALLELTRKGQQPAQPAAPVDKAPTREQFQTWEEYEDARVDWKLEQKTKAQTERQVKELTEHLQKQQAQQYEQELTNQHVARTQQFARAVPDFEDVTDRDDIVIPPSASEAIRSMPNSPAIVYAIGRDPSLAHRMQDMTPMQQAAYVGQLSVSLMQRTPQVSNAPSPGRPVGSKPSSASDAPSDTEAYFAWANKKFGRK